MTRDFGPYVVDEDRRFELDRMPAWLVDDWERVGKPRGADFAAYAREDHCGYFSGGSFDDALWEKLDDEAWVKQFIKRSEAFANVTRDLIRDAKKPRFQVVAKDGSAHPVPAAWAEAGRHKLRWHGEVESAPQAMLVADTLPEQGVVCIAGQWGAGKTFVATDLYNAVLNGGDFMGKPVLKTGGVLCLAGEGEHEVFTRLEASHKYKGDETYTSLPFASQKIDVSMPALNAPGSLDFLKELVAEMKERLESREEDLALISIDTVGSLTTFKDDHAAGEIKKLYVEVLRPLARYSGALVLLIDHYGKSAESGIAGSYAKGAALDALIGVLKDGTEHRAVVEKSRCGPTGRAVSFDLRPVPIGDLERTTCIVEWSTSENVEITANRSQLAKNHWSGKARVLRQAIDVAITDHGQLISPFLPETGPQVMAVPMQHVRDEFYKSYAVDAEGKTAAATKRQAFNRLLDAARSKNLVATREVQGKDWLWFVQAEVAA